MRHASRVPDSVIGGSAHPNPILEATSGHEGPKGQASDRLVLQAGEWSVRTMRNSRKAAPGAGLPVKVEALVRRLVAGNYDQQLRSLQHWRWSSD